MLVYAATIQVLESDLEDILITYRGRKNVFTALKVSTLYLSLCVLITCTLLPFPFNFGSEINGS